jgi:hypothetical protein
MVYPNMKVCERSYGTIKMNNFGIFSLSQLIANANFTKFKLVQEDIPTTNLAIFIIIIIITKTQVLNYLLL